MVSELSATAQKRALSFTRDCVLVKRGWGTDSTLLSILTGLGNFPTYGQGGGNLYMTMVTCVKIIKLEIV